MPAHLTVSTTLPAPPAAVWEAIQTSEVVARVAYPLFVFRDPRPGPMPPRLPDTPHSVSMWAWGWIPLGRQTLHIAREAAGPDQWVLHDRGSGDITRTWDHTITLTPNAEGTRMVDELTIDAGWLTGVVRFYAQRWLRNRHQRLPDEVRAFAQPGAVAT